jgi:head-tail adaptor
MRSYERRQQQVPKFADGLSEQAKALIGIQKEATVVKTMTDEMPQAAVVSGQGKVVVEPAGFEMVIDSPKEYWDAVGHVQLKFVVKDYDEVLAKIGECTAVWAAIKEDFAEEFAKADAMSPAQATLLKRLLGVKDLSEADAALSKADASVKIEGLMKDQPKGGINGAPPAGYGGGATNRFQRKTAEPAGKGGGVSEATIKYATQIAERKRITLPSDFVMWSQSEASDWIKSNK